MKGADNAENVEAHVPMYSQTHRSHIRAQVLWPQKGTALYPRAFALTFLWNLIGLNIIFARTLSLNQIRFSHAFPSLSHLTNIRS